MADPERMEVDSAGVSGAVRNLLSQGLPARLHDGPGALLELRGVIARAVTPMEPVSRLDALNGLLKRLIRRWPRPIEGKALAALFGLEKGYGGRTLTDRRGRAAEHLGYAATHFRKEVEPRLVADLAEALWQDHLRYTPRTRYAPPPIAANGDTPVLDAGDYTEQEELVSRIWSEVHGLRAEIIAGGRIKRDQGRHDELPDARGKILWRTARLLSYIEEYLQGYGENILQGETEWNVEGLVRLAGWRGGIASDVSRRMRLTLSEAGEEDYGRFLHLLSKR